MSTALYPKSPKLRRVPPARPQVAQRRVRARRAFTLAVVACLVVAVATAVGLDVSARQARGRAHRLVATRAERLSSARGVLGGVDADLGGAHTGVHEAATAAEMHC